VANSSPEWLNSTVEMMSAVTHKVDLPFQVAESFTCPDLTLDPKEGKGGVRQTPAKQQYAQHFKNTGSNYLKVTVK